VCDIASPGFILTREQSKCLKFADPYVEHDSLTLLLDLILLKREVYRHLIYNRGTEPRKAFGKNKSGDEGSLEENQKLAPSKNRQREKVRDSRVLQMTRSLSTLVGQVVAHSEACLRAYHG